MILFLQLINKIYKTKLGTMKEQILEMVYPKIVYNIYKK
jgi:hypothetical protein